MDAHRQVALVTGATFGIGAETAIGIAQTGAHVVIVGRDAAKAAHVLARIASEAPEGTGAFLAADLSTSEGVRALSEEFRATHDRLDILVNNAGVMLSERSVTADGVERHWALNHLAYVRLTLTLLPLIRAGAPSRIVNVTSDLHARGVIDFDDLETERGYNGFMKAYSQSKLANVMFTYVLARRLEGSGVAANCAHPGVVNTGLAAGVTGVMKLIVPVMRLFMITPEQGARTSIYLATSPEVEGVSGHYFVKSRAIRSSAASYDEAVQERLWKLSLEQVGLDDIAISHNDRRIS